MNRMYDFLTCSTYVIITAHPVSVSTFSSDFRADSSTSLMLSGLDVKPLAVDEGVCPKGVEWGIRPSRPK